MGRHGVPYAAGRQFGHAHLQLACGQHLAHEHLVDVALVAHFERAHVCNHGVGLGYLLAGILLVGGDAVEVELCRLLRVGAAEHHIAVAAAYVECFFVAQGERLAAHLNGAFAQPDVEYAHLAARGEVFGLQRVDGLELQLFADRHCPAYYHSVVHGVHHVHFVGCEHALDEEVAPDALGVIAFCVLGVGRIANLIVCLHNLSCCLCLLSLFVSALVCVAVGCACSRQHKAKILFFCRMAK